MVSGSSYCNSNQSATVNFRFLQKQNNKRNRCACVQNKHAGPASTMRSLLVPLAATGQIGCPLQLYSRNEDRWHFPSNGNAPRDSWRVTSRQTTRDDTMTDLWLPLSQLPYLAAAGLHFYSDRVKFRHHWAACTIVFIHRTEIVYSPNGFI